MRLFFKTNIIFFKKICNFANYFLKNEKTAIFNIIFYNLFHDQHQSAAVGNFWIGERH